MSELSDKLAGKAKQAAGKVSNDKKLQAEGKAQELKADAQKHANDVADKVKESFKNK